MLDVEKLGRQFFLERKDKKFIHISVGKIPLKSAVECEALGANYISGVALRVGGNVGLHIVHFLRLLGAFYLRFLQPVLLFLKCETNVNLLVGIIDEFSDIVRFGVRNYVA
jgi:hypothetical protein